MHRQNVFLLLDGDVFKFVLALGHVHGDAVQRQLLQHALQIVAGALAQRQVDGGVLLLELRDHGEDRKRTADARDADAQAAEVRLCNVAQGRHHALLQGKDLLDVIEVAFAGVGQDHAAVDALEQRRPQLGFLLFEKAGQRRL